MGGTVLKGVHGQRGRLGGQAGVGGRGVRRADVQDANGDEKLIRSHDGTADLPRRALALVHRNTDRQAACMSVSCLIA